MGVLPDPADVIDPQLQRALKRRMANDPGFKQQQRKQFIRSTIKKTVDKFIQERGSNNQRRGEGGGYLEG